MLDQAHKYYYLYKRNALRPVGPGSQSFSDPGIDSFVVPAGKTSITTKVWGGGGAGCSGGDVPGTYSGAGAGYVKGTLTVTPGETLSIYIAGGGRNFDTDQGTGGSNGGGSSGGGGSGGGGFSGITRGSTPLLIAAGGGAAQVGQDDTPGGVGGGSTGGDGLGPGGRGGTQLKGGVSSSGAGGWSGGGVNGPGETNIGNGDSWSAGFSGGDGYYDGSGSGAGAGYFGGGGGNGSGGGGGSNFVSGTGTVNGQAVGDIPPNTADPDYIASIGVGGGQAQDGGDGLVVISWT